MAWFRLRRFGDLEKSEAPIWRDDIPWSHSELRVPFRSFGSLFAGFFSSALLYHFLGWRVPLQK